MKYIIILLFIIGCGRAESENGYKIYLNLSGMQRTQTTNSLALLQILSKNPKIQFGDEKNHDILVEYTSNAEAEKVVSGYILGLAWTSEIPCRIQITERTYFYGQDWIDSVLWHEIGHCFELPHINNSEDIMYKYAKPLSRYSEASLQEFFRRLHEKTR